MKMARSAESQLYWIGLNREKYRMNSILKAGTSLIVFLSIGCAYADGAYSVDTSSEANTGSKVVFW
ncbi:hypothetical protein IMCC3135_16245 [Granulosicoccus antarcticus IMCC3135]|uniref:Uncharacterized protein n=1 Tax=Granulosicoccus antarcticus IMCC3135 TaxID=1192854 RepID=A0A2Z2NTF2_9GAMM|nr:hypothetical protein IMCC3135_16245 [Granulosicoccus antarcticus IMCC3135]